MDKKVRAVVRKALHLPKDTPKAAFHASIKEGDLGIASFATAIPALIKNRLRRLEESEDEVVQAAARGTPKPPTVPPKHWANKLHTTIDRAGLRESQLSPTSLRWVDSGTRLLRGAAYVQAIKTQLRVLTTPARSARGRDLDSSCKLGCGVPETLHHILQVCPRVQPWRITRNNMVNLVSDKLREKGYKVLKEPRIPTTHGRIPDIICWDKELPFIIDGQVCGDSNALPLQEAHTMKVTKYNIPEVIDFTKEKAGNQVDPVVSSLTCNWRGIMAPPTERLLT